MSGEEKGPLDFDENALEIADRIYTTVNYSGKPASVVFPVQKAKFFAELFKSGSTIETACAKIGITKTQASRWLSDKQTKEYLAEICDRLEVVKGQTVENYINEMWQVWRGEKELSDTQRWAGDKLGKIMGLFKERIITESEPKEIRFVGQDSNPQLPASSGPAQSLPIEGSFYISDGGTTVGEIPS